MAKNYSFGEKEVESVKNAKTGEWEEVQVWQSPKYKTSKDKAIEMIESKKYDLTEADFWILMNKTGTGKMAYTGLIISHNGCLKINDKLDNKVNPKCFSIDKEGYAGSLVYTYIDDDTYEVGEFNKDNGKNPYPYAMAFKRCFDRVVLKKSKLAFSEIYSEVEADEFREQQEDDETKEMKQHQNLEEILDKLIVDKGINYDYLTNMYKAEDIHLMTNKQLKNAIENIDKIKMKQTELECEYESRKMESELK